MSRAVTISAGELNRRISLRILSESSDPNNDDQVNRAWTPVATVYAKVEPIRGSKFFKDDKTTAEEIVKFTIRYRRDVAENWGIWMDTRRGQRTFTVIDVKDIGDAHVYLEIQAKEHPYGEPV